MSWSGQARETLTDACDPAADLLRCAYRSRPCRHTAGRIFTMIAQRFVGVLALGAALLLGGTTGVAAQSPEVLRKLHELKHDGHVGGVFFAATEGEIVTCAWDGTIHYWDAKSGAPKEILTINANTRGLGKSEGKVSVPPLNAVIPWDKNKWLFLLPADMGLGVYDREKRKFGANFKFPNRAILANYVRGPE